MTTATATETKTKGPLIKELGDGALREHYRGLRELAYNNAEMASSGAVNRRKAAAQMGRLMRHIEICEAVARRRGVSLATQAEVSPPVEKTEPCTRCTTPTAERDLMGRPLCSECWARQETNAGETERE